MRHLQPNEFNQALTSVFIWQHSSENVITCPACHVNGLKIEDRSTRPHAEWYQLDCPNCGLTETVHIPMARSPAEVNHEY